MFKEDEVICSVISRIINPQGSPLVVAIRRCAGGTFDYNYHAMKDSKWRLHEELIRTLSHPKYISKFADWGFTYLF